MNKKILLKLEVESSENEHDEVKITEDCDRNYLQVVLKDYDKKDWTGRGQKHTTALEQAVIDLMDSLGVSANKHYYTKNYFVKTLFNDLGLGNDINASMEATYTDSTMWGRRSAIFRMTALTDYDKTVEYEEVVIDVKKHEEFKIDGVLSHKDGKRLSEDELSCIFIELIESKGLQFGGLIKGYDDEK